MILDLGVGDIQSLISNLSPTGDAWSTELDTVRMQEILALSGTFQRLQERANYLVTDMFPATALELLPEWEASVGLPDLCSGPDATIAQRQAHVVARLVQTDGPSKPSLTAFAAALGFVITITEYAPARADWTGADDPVYEPEWAFVWTVNTALLTVDYASADISYADDPLLTFGNSPLQCELMRLSPAHTVLQFAFEG